MSDKIEVPACFSHYAPVPACARCGDVIKCARATVNRSSVFIMPVAKPVVRKRAVAERLQVLK